MKITVLGDGGWGTAIALLLHENGHRTRLWSAFAEHVGEIRRDRENRRFLPGFPIPDEILVTAEGEEAFEGAELVFSVIPTQFLRRSIERLAPEYRGQPIVSATKGLELKTLSRPSEILRAVLGEEIPHAVFSGPSHAEEVARLKATVVVAASEDEAVARAVQDACSCARFRVYTSDDPIGVELGGALKNIIAIAAGICDGLELGDNAKAALLTRGLVEMARFGVSRGARRETFGGLAGMGDLITTCYSPFGRNRMVGEKLGRGQSREQILGGMEMVAEGVWTTQAIHDAASAADVEMPITAQVYRVLFEGKDPGLAVSNLMQRDPQSE